MSGINSRQEMEGLLAIVAEEGASDLHLSVGRYPTVRIDGRLVPLDKKQVLSAKDSEELITSILDDNKKKQLFDEHELDFSYELEGKTRFRVNVFFQRGTLGAAFRLISSRIRTLEELGMPSSVYDFTKSSQGFVLVTGPSGHGKSTTLAALVDRINMEKYEHVITVEDPIEYVYTQNHCMIDQREVGTDTKSFSNALRAIFREDADVILVGELRDWETISMAITAAETGHLVFATLHTNSAAQTIDRIIDSFPASQQNQVRAQLSGNLLGVVSQRLIPRIGGGRVPAVEIMKSNSAVKNLIRENKIHQLDLVINTSADEGMISLNNSLAKLVKEGEISIEDAVTYSTNANDLKMLLRR
ncbi:MAG: type IV pilus twitching motility protein PilT [Candidatus Paceibacterota bacterium]